MNFKFYTVLKLNIFEVFLKMQQRFEKEFLFKKSDLKSFRMVSFYVFSIV